jgi:hypothetical protein
MLTSTTLHDKPREFLAATGLTPAECARLLPAFATAYAALYPPDKTLEGKPRQRRVGGAATGALPPIEDQRLCLLVFQKTKLLHTMHGLPCDLRHPQTPYWRYRFRPVLQHALHAMGQAPEREVQRVETRALALAGAPNLAVDGTDRRRHRPRAAAMPKDHDSGKKKPHTDDNLLLLNAHPGQVVSLGPPLPGKRHDKQAVEFKCCTKTLAKSHSH